MTTTAKNDENKASGTENNIILKINKNKYNRKKQNNEIALNELKKMLCVYITGFSILIIASIMWCALNQIFDYRLFSGAVAGTLASAGYFLSLGYSTEKVLMRKNNKKSGFSANLWYGARYAGLFALYVLLLIFNLVNVITAVIPLFFPRIYYFLTVFKKEDKNS